MVRNPETIGEKISTFQFQTKHIYYLLAAATIISGIWFADEKMIVPKWPLIFGIGLIAVWGFGEQWEAWRRKGCIVLTTLGKEKGGQTGIQYEGDVIIARSYKDSKKPNYACVATGGFNYFSFSQHGKENFLIVPPEHVMKFHSNWIIKTRLRRVHYQQLEKYVQDSLTQLPGFRLDLVHKRNNIWLGHTSDYYGTDKDDNLQLEQKGIRKTDVDNEMDHLLDDIIERKVQIRDKPKGYDVVTMKESNE